MATVYKKFTVQEMDGRNSAPVSSDDNTAINTVVSNFITYFKAKHS